MGDLDVPVLLRRLGINANRRGREWTAICPNPEHDDRSPSWRMRDEPGAKKHGFHKCWPCGFGGNAVDLVERLIGIDWRAAKEWIGADVFAEDTPVAESVEVKQRPWDTSFRLPAGVEVLLFDLWPQSVRAYVTGRAITPWQVDRWGVGFAVDGRLNGRVVFVKRDSDGEPVGFSARTFVGAMKRYLEPEPWEGASQAAVFGEQHWSHDFRMRLGQSVFVVEGAINALAVERAALREAGGLVHYPSVAATSGSQLGALVAAKLASFGEIVAVTDPDAAGDKLAAALSDTLARHDRKFRRVRLPVGHDAADVPEAALREAVG